MKRLLFIMVLVICLSLAASNGVLAVSAPSNLKYRLWRIGDLGVYYNSPGHWINDTQAFAYYYMSLSANKPDGGSLGSTYLQFELKPMDSSFNETYDQSSADGNSVLKSVDGLADGKYKWRVRSYYDGFFGDDYSDWVNFGVGNWGEMDFGIDRQPPANITISSGTHGSGWSNKTTGTYGVGYSEPTSGVGGFSTSITKGIEGHPGSPFGSLNGTLNFNQGSGTYYVNVTMKDNAGNWSNTVHKAYYIDVDDPSFNLITSSSPTNNYVRGTVKLSGSGIDSLSGVKYISFSDNNKPLAEFTSNSYSYNWNTSKTNNGKHIITYLIMDKASNSSTITKTFYVDNYKPKTYAPYKATVKKGAYTKLYWKVLDKYTANKAYVTLKIRKGSKWVKIIKLNGGRLTTINKTLYCRYKALLSKGTYKFYVYAKDRAGNNQANAAYNYLIVK